MAIYRVTPSADQTKGDRSTLPPLTDHYIKIGDDGAPTHEGAVQAALQVAEKAANDGLLKGCWAVNFDVWSNPNFWEVRITHQSPLTTPDFWQVRLARIWNEKRGQRNKTSVRSATQGAPTPPAMLRLAKIKNIITACIQFFRA